MKPISVMIPGRHLSSAGLPVHFTEGDLLASANAYDPALHEAPLVIGHPKTDAPAYGWVQGVAFGEGRLYATPRQVSPEFAEGVNSGAYKMRSAAFYHPADPRNPVPGVYYLRHVGFLGAQPPAVKGLSPYTFADGGEADLVEVSFGETGYLMGTIAEVFRSLREFLLTRFDKDAADTVLPDRYITSLTEMAASEAAQTQPAALFAEGHLPEENPMPKPDPNTPAATRTQPAPDPREAEFAERGQSLAAREAALAEREAAAAREEAVRFTEGLVSAGRLLPAQQAGVVELLLAQPATEITFAEGGKQTTVAGGEFLRGFLSGLPVQVDFAERAGAGAQGLDESDPAAIARAIQDLQFAEAQAGRSLTASQALAQLRGNQR